MNEVRRARPLLGTIVQIYARGTLSETELHAAVTAAFAEIALVHSLMSWHERDSELSRLNRCAAESIQTLHPHTRTVLQAALYYSRLSDGAFDPCIAAALTQWGLLPMPSPNSTAPARQASWRDIELTAAGVRFRQPLWLDLGGIAKGYAVDLAVTCLQEQGVSQVLVNAGGDLRVAGLAQHAAIRHPRSAHAVVHELLLDNEALATSSAFESRHEGPTGAICALVDPSTGAAYGGLDSVSVRASTCIAADALTKVALFAPRAIAAAVFDTCSAHCVRLEAGAQT